MAKIIEFCQFHVNNVSSNHLGTMAWDGNFINGVNNPTSMGLCEGAHFLPLKDLIDFETKGH